MPKFVMSVFIHVSTLIAAFPAFKCLSANILGMVGPRQRKYHQNRWQQKKTQHGPSKICNKNLRKEWASNIESL